MGASFLQKRGRCLRELYINFRKVGKKKRDLLFSFFLLNFFLFFQFMALNGPTRTGLPTAHRRRRRSYTWRRNAAVRLSLPSRRTLRSPSPTASAPPDVASLTSSPPLIPDRSIRLLDYSTASSLSSQCCTRRNELRCPEPGHPRGHQNARAAPPARPRTRRC